jgi:hypothetical protein
LDGNAFLALSPHAVKLLIDLGAQYRGDNNGDLCAAWKVMRARRWRSEATLAKAKRELIDSGLIVETRKGARPNKASLYALTWFALDHCGGKLDIGPGGFAYGAFRERDRHPLISSHAVDRRATNDDALATATEVDADA